MLLQWPNMKRKIALITNPAAGKPDAILSYVTETLPVDKFDWEVFVVKKAGDTKAYVKKAIKQKFDVVAVHGGDGTITDAAQGLFKSHIPLAIIPGGTANIVAKELGIPPDIKQALALIATKKLKTKKIDMGLLNNQPFLSRIEMGLHAKMALGTPEKQKQKFGQIAYTVSAIKQILDSRTHNYTITADGKTKKFLAYSVLIANFGNTGMARLSVTPQVDITDGILDVVVVGSERIKAFFNWVNAHVRTKSPKSHLYHIKAREVIISTHKTQKINFDDEAMSTKELTIKIAPKSLQVVVP